VKRFSKAALGGTFDLFHDGHKYFLESALRMADRLVIGLTTDEFASYHKSHPVEPYDLRMERLTRFLEERGALMRAEIVPLSDPYGPTAWDGSIEALIVTADNRERAGEINALRALRGLRALEAVEIPLKLGEDGVPISSARIRGGR